MTRLWQPIALLGIMTLLAADLYRERSQPTDWLVLVAFVATSALAAVSLGRHRTVGTHRLIVSAIAVAAGGVAGVVLQVLTDGHGASLGRFWSHAGPVMFLLALSLAALGVEHLWNARRGRA